MSRDVLTKGIAAVLIEPLSEDDRIEISEYLYDTQRNLKLNYHGDLLFQYENEPDVYGIFWQGTAFYRGSMIGAIDSLPLDIRNKLKIRQESTRPFVEIWYNGVDSIHETMTAKEFLDNMK